MIIFMFGIVLTIVLFIAMGFVRGEGMSWRVNKKQLLALVGVLVIVFSCYVSIPAGHTGVVTTFGSVENYTLEAGMHFKLPWQEVIKMDNRVQKSTQDMSCFSSDIQEVSMTYTVNYQISKQDAMTIYKTIGIGYYDTVIAPCITESVKIVTAQYTAEDLVSSRSLMASQIEEVLSQKLAAYNIELVGASIENMDFTDAFTDAVEAKQVAEQNKLRAETEAQQRVLEANAAAEIKRIEAEADAYELTTRAEAEAEANRKIAESLTEALIAYTYAENWDARAVMSKKRCRRSATSRAAPDAGILSRFKRVRGGTSGGIDGHFSFYQRYVAGFVVVRTEIEAGSQHTGSQVFGSYNEGMFRILAYLEVGFSCEFYNPFLPGKTGGIAERTFYVEPYNGAVGQSHLKVLASRCFQRMYFCRFFFGRGDVISNSMTAFYVGSGNMQGVCCLFG